MKLEPIAKTSSSDRESLEQDFETLNVIERVRVNQQKLTADLKRHYDFIVCGSGSSGSVVARRLAENPLVDVLLVEVGGSDDVPEVMEASKWPLNRASERNWGFLGQPSRYLNGRSIQNIIRAALTNHHQAPKKIADPLLACSGLLLNQLPYRIELLVAGLLHLQRA